MKIAYIADWYPANFNRFLSIAFEGAGHTVERWGRTFPGHYGIAWGSETAFMSSVKSLPETHIDLSAIDADLIFLSDCRADFPVIGKPSCPVTLYEPEGWDHWKRRETIPGVVAAFTPMPYGVMYRWYDEADHEHSALHDGWVYLPGAWLESVHPAGSIPIQKREYDYISHAIPYNFRPRLIAHLADNSLRVGSGPVAINGYVNSHHNAIATGDSHEGQEYVKWRVFEAGGMGTVLLHSRCRLMDSLGYIPGYHYIEIPQNPTAHERELGRVEPDFAAVLRVVQSLRAQPERACWLAANHHALIQNRHTYAHRVQTVLDAVKDYL